MDPAAHSAHRAAERPASDAALYTALHQLMSALQPLLTEHERLLRLAEQQKQALVARDTNQLQRVIGQMEQATQRVRQLEAERQAAAEDVARALHLDPAALTLTALQSRAAEVDPRLARQLQQTGQRLRDAVTRLARQNDENQRLIQQAIAYTDRFFAWVAEHAGGTTYGPGHGSPGPGQPAGSPAHLAFDLKA